MCGSREGLETRAISRVFTPTWVWFLLPFGILPAALVGLAVQTKHVFSLRVCQRCSGKRRWSAAVHWLAMLCCLVLIVVAICVGIIDQSWLTFLGVMALACTVAFASGRFHERTSPRYSVFTKEKVEIEIPGLGRYVVFPS